MPRLTDADDERHSEQSHADVEAAPPLHLSPRSLVGRAGALQGVRAFRHRNYRLHWIGQIVRGTGMWMHMVSIPWLVLELDGSPIDLGIVSAAQYLPALFLSPLGGVLADRLPKRQLLMVLQFTAALLAAALFTLVLTDIVEMWHVYTLAGAIGLVTAAELPVRQAFTAELVPKRDLMNAISLHSAAWNTTRLIGPGVAGVMIATAGLAPTLAATAVTAVFVVGTLALFDPRRIHGTTNQTEPQGVAQELWDAVQYARHTPTVKWSLVLIGGGGAFGIMTFQTLAPIYAVQQLGLSSAGYGTLFAVWGGGAVVAAFAIAFAGRQDSRRLMLGGAVALSIFLFALSRNEAPELAFVLAAVLGFCQIIMVQNVNLTIQGLVPNQLRGRVLGLYITVFHGVNPFGALIAGGLAETIGVAMAMTIGAIALMLLTAVVWWRLRASPGWRD